MKNIYSNIFKFNKNTLKKAINYLKKNEVLAFPTETVYGLGGNAYSKKSVQKIYKIKKRPKINPLIIHYHNYKDAIKDVEINDTFIKIYKKLSPGPITFILKKKENSKITALANANLDTVAIRFPKNSTIRLILKKINFPLAIPSANYSSGVSPVDALDVADEFNNKIKMIINGGRSRIGIESTVIDLTNNLKILRSGAINKKQIESIIKKKISFQKRHLKIKAPGSLKRHYSPGIPMFLNQKKSLNNQAFIIFGKKYKKTNNTFNLSLNSDLKIAAKNLYKVLRKIKKLKYKEIYVAKIPNKEIGIAINDRLKRAAY